MLDLIVLATKNEGKARELALLLEGLARRVESLAAHPDVSLPPETGKTYRENALLKARAVNHALGVPALADDSGLEVDALGGAPGPNSARYAGPDASDFEKIDKLLRKLAVVPQGKRAVRFRCVLALVRGAKGGEVVVEGVCEGRIVELPRGAGGFGYDPIFLPHGEARTFAELPTDLKNRISHRARAARALRALPGYDWGG